MTRSDDPIGDLLDDVRADLGYLDGDDEHRVDDDADLSDYSEESGRHADPEPIVRRIAREHAQADIDISRDGVPKALDWNDPEHRERLRRQFGGDAENQEAILPGFGEDGDGSTAEDDCGDGHPWVCPGCGHAVEFGRTCARSVCSRCAVAWARDLAISKSAKIRRVRKTKHQNTHEREWQKLHHQIISPSIDWYAALARRGLSLEEAQERTREVVKEILDEMCAQGLLVRHSFRGKRDDGSIAAETDDRGAWKERINSEREFYGDVRDQLAWRPHYHCIVVGDWLQGEAFTDVVEEITGWVIHRISRSDNASLRNDGAMAKALTYTVSHADIIVREEGNNRSAIWEVGSFEGDPIRSSSRFVAAPHDLEWADRAVRRNEWEVLGLSSATTECGETLPGVDDPDELARRVLEELYPDDAEGRSRVSTDAVLSHIAAGNIRVEVETLDGGGGDVSVRTGPQRPGELVPRAGAGAVVDGGGEALAPIDDVDVDDQDGGADDREHAEHGDGCDHDHDDDQHDDECSSTLVPLGEFRARGLLDDPEWCRSAPHVDEARDTDREWPRDLTPWRSESPGSAVGVDEDDPPPD